MRATTRVLTPELWPAVEELFGSKGACGGCWCQAWRTEKGERWKDVQGAVARERLRAGVLDGSVHAVLAFDGQTPVGWCTFGPRTSFPKLDRAPSLRCDDAARVWSIPCFYVARGRRGQGVATALLAHALRAMAARGAEIAEGYPSRPGPDGRYIDAFSWTGTRSLFEKAGFTVAGNPDGGKVRVRKILRNQRGRRS